MTFCANSVAQDDTAWSLVKPLECRFSGEFTQEKLLQGLDHSLVSNGIFFYDCKVGIIWKTITPNTESYVLNKSGDSFIVKRLKIEAIQSQQHKLVSQLIMALVSADEAFLSSTFEQTRTDTNSVVLTPKDRRLKRAIQSITLTENSVGNITFEMLDQNQQTTAIASNVLANYPPNSITDIKIQCSEIAELNDTECGLLNTTID